jgi:membrane protein
VNGALPWPPGEGPISGAPDKRVAGARPKARGRCRPRAGRTPVCASGKSIGDDHISLVAAGTAFFGLLAIFPALTAFVSVYGLIADPATVQNQVAALRGVAPEAAIEIIETQLTRIVEQSGTTHG